MLRESIDVTGIQCDMKSIVTGSGSLMPHGDLLLQLSDALIEGDDQLLLQVRTDLVAAVDAEFAAAAVGVVANFEMMNRLLDATGVPVQRRYLSVEQDLGLKG